MMDEYATSPLLINIIELSSNGPRHGQYFFTAWALKGHQIFFAFAKIALL